MNPRRWDKPTRWLALLIIAAFVARLLLAWYSIGSNDAVTFRMEAISINEHGLLDAYRRFFDLNHPPLSPLWWSAAQRMAEASGASFEPGRA